MGENLIESGYGKSWEVLFYFALLNKMVTDYYNENPSNSLAFGDFGLGHGRELLFGNNINNSCAMVAAEIAMQYYDRIGIARFIPNDLSSLRLSYDFEYNDGNIELLFSKQNKNAFRSEWLHQELIYCTYPEKIGKPSLSFECNLSTLKEGLATYSNRSGIVFDTSRRSGRFGIETQIKNGNPVIVNFNGAYTLGIGTTGTVGQHLAVVTAYDSYYVFEDIAIEMSVNFGWHKKGYSYVFISPAIIDENLNFEVF